MNTLNQEMVLVVSNASGFTRGADTDFRELFSGLRGMDGE